MRLLRAILFFIATLLIYLGVSLLGWGLGDLGGILFLQLHALDMLCSRRVIQPGS